jgi:hypothetical protein
MTTTKAILGIGFLLSCWACITRQQRQNVALHQEPWSVSKLTGDSIWPKSTAWGWFDGKFEVAIEAGNEQHTLKGRVRMQQDSSVLIQLRPSIGVVDIARLWLRTDSVFMLDLLQNVAYTGRTDTFPISLGAMQSMMMGSAVPLMPTQTYTVEQHAQGSIRAFTSGGLTMLQHPHMVLPAQALVWNPDRTLAQMEWGQPEQSLRLSYFPEKFSTLQSVMVAMESQIQWRAKDQQGLARFSFSKIEVGVPTSLSLSIPKHFPQRNIRDFSMKR